MQRCINLFGSVRKNVANYLTNIKQDVNYIQLQYQAIFLYVETMFSETPNSVNQRLIFEKFYHLPLMINDLHSRGQMNQQSIKTYKRPRIDLLQMTDVELDLPEMRPYPGFRLVSKSM